MFVQDRWRVNDRLSFELGMRVDFDDIVEGVNYSPRAGMSVSLLPEGRGILRGGFGKFSERTPLTVGAFTQYDVQTVSRFAADGAPLGAPVTFVHVLDGKLRTPESIVQTVAWDQRFGRRFFFKAAYLHRDGSHAYTINPDPSRGVLTLGSVGESENWELETTGRFLASEYRDLSVSYVRSHGTRDLNDYDQFYGNFRNPIIRFNANSLNPTDVPNRLIVRGTIGLPGKWVFSPIYEWRTGFPWSAVNEFQDFVGERNEAGRLPTVSTLDFTLARPWRFRKYHFTAGLKVYNVFDAGNERDVQNNITSPDYGKFYNPIQRSIGFVFGRAGRDFRGRAEPYLTPRRPRGSPSGQNNAFARQEATLQPQHEQRFQTRPKGDDSSHYLDESPAFGAPDGGTRKDRLQLFARDERVSHAIGDAKIVVTGTSNAAHRTGPPADRPTRLLLRSDRSRPIADVAVPAVAHIVLTAESFCGK